MITCKNYLFVLLSIGSIGFRMRSSEKKQKLLSISVTPQDVRLQNQQWSFEIRRVDSILNQMNYRNLPGDLEYKKQIKHLIKNNDLISLQHLNNQYLSVLNYSQEETCSCVII